MKLLMFYTRHFSFRTARRSLPDVPEVDESGAMDDAVVVFFHVEAADQEKRGKVIQKFVKNIKWLCGKFSTRNVVLHSFNHLSSSKASPEFSLEVLEETRRRLDRTGYQLLVTPFGYFNEFAMQVAGDSLAKVFKEF